MVNLYVRVHSNIYVICLLLEKEDETGLHNKHGCHNTDIALDTPTPAGVLFLRVRTDGE